MNIRFITLLMFVIASSACAFGENDGTKKFAYSSYEKAILVSAAKSLSGLETDSDSGGLILLLGYIDTAESRAILLNLIRYYVGSANGEALTYAVYLQGKKIINGLKLIDKDNYNCSQINFGGGLSLKCASAEEVKDRVEGLIKAIVDREEMEYAL